MIEQLRTQGGPVGLDWIDLLFWTAAVLVVWKVWTDLNPYNRLPRELFAMLVSVVIVMVVAAALLLVA